MLRAVIVDNETSAIEDLQTALGEFCPEVTLAGTFRTLEEAIQGIGELQPGIVFLDIELSGGVTGFDVLEKIPSRNFEVIFVTAYDQYAARAFHFSATHYLEKPVDGTLLREAVERVKKKRSENDFRLQLQVLTESMRNLTSLPKQIILPNPKQGDSIVVPVQDVIRVEASGPQAIFYIRWNGKIEKTMYSLNIGALQKKMLQGHDDFIMIHESHIINRNHITHYNAKSHAVQMADGTFIVIAKRRVSEFLEKFNR
ncbi:MAG TPA: LytTR family DNA-binding domain-containing protein [Chitinophagales bacterium]|nr:LytTR family DNA-binding domain-containing protein [Chitinophagales bacterium]